MPCCGQHSPWQWLARSTRCTRAASLPQQPRAARTAAGGEDGPAHRQMQRKLLPLTRKLPGQRKLQMRRHRARRLMGCPQTWIISRQWVCSRNLHQSEQLGCYILLKLACVIFVRVAMTADRIPVG